MNFWVLCSLNNGVCKFSLVVDLVKKIFWQCKLIKQIYMKIFAAVSVDELVRFILK